MNDEARAFALFVKHNFPASKDFSLQTMRERSENIHRKANEKLIGTFKGKEEERTLTVDENTGKTKVISENK